MTDPDPTVVRLRRPPVRQDTLVRSGIDHTFDVFVRTIGTWWPRRISAGQQEVADVTLEQRAGGRVYETWQDGTVVDWGTILDWSPPAGFTMTWAATPVPTEVALTFQALGPALTRVAVEHRGWEALSAEQAARDCALPGGYDGGAYAQGWAMVLGGLAAAVAMTPEGVPAP
jgi:hypothetical protein